MLIVPPSPNVEEAQGQQDLVEGRSRGWRASRTWWRRRRSCRGSRIWWRTQPRSPGQQDVVETQSQLPGQPDLVVGSPTVSDSGPAGGARFILSDNGAQRWGWRLAGDDVCAATGSTDATITTSDAEVGEGSGGGAGRLGERRRVGGADGAVEFRHVLLRRVRGMR